MADSARPSKVAVQTSSLLLITLPSLLSGLILELLLARAYGSSSVVDAFRIASLIYLFALNLFFMHLTPHVVIPAYSVVLAQKGVAHAWKVLLSVNAVFCYSLSVPLLLVWLKPDVVLNVLAPGLAAVASSEATILLRAAVVSFFLLLVSGPLSGALQVHGILWPNAVAPTLLSASTIAMVIGSRPQFAAGGLAAGVVIGSLLIAALHFLYVYRLAKPHGVKLRDWIVPTYYRETVRFVGGFSPMALAALSGHVVNIIVFRSLTGLSVGAAALYGYALKLTHLVFTPAAKFATVIFPRLAHSHATQDDGRFIRVLDSSVRVVLLLAVPSAAICWVLRLPLASALFGTASLTADEVTLIGNLFGILLLASPTGALNALIVKSCAARRRTGATLAGALAGLLLVAVLLGPLSRAFGSYGVATAWVAGSVCDLAVLLFFARFRVVAFITRSVSYLGRVLLVAGAGASLAAMGTWLLPLSPADGLEPRVLVLFLTFAVFTSTFLVSALVRIEESLVLLHVAQSFVRKVNDPLALPPTEQ